MSSFVMYEVSTLWFTSDSGKEYWLVVGTFQNSADALEDMLMHVDKNVKRVYRIKKYADSGDKIICAWKVGG